MAKKKPPVLGKHEDEDTGTITEILRAEHIYAVWYQGEPVNIAIRKGESNTYPKSTYPTPGHAHNLADKLNKQFGTKDFWVYKIDNGRPVKRGDK